MILAVSVIVFLFFALVIHLHRKGDFIDVPPDEIPCNPNFPDLSFGPNHFIKKKQHRYDEARERHKRNQTPW